MPRSTKILIAVALLLSAFAILVSVKAGSVLIQLFMSLALAYLLNPLVRKIERKGAPRIVAVILVFCLALSGMALSLTFLVMTVKSELADVQLNIPGYAKHMYEIVPTEVKVQLQIDTPEKISIQLDKLTREFRSVALDIAKPVLGWLQNALTSTIGFILNILGYLIIPIFLFYLLVDMPLLVAWIRDITPQRFRQQLKELTAEIDCVLASFVRGQLIVCGILAVLYSAGLWIIGIDLAVAIGTVAGIAFIIPYVGTILGIVLSMTMALLKFHDILHPLLCLGWFCIVQALEGMVITPKVVGNTVGLHPVIAIVALLIGGQLIGLWGMLLAIPVAAVIKVFACRLLAHYRDSEFFLGN